MYCFLTWNYYSYKFKVINIELSNTKQKTRIFASLDDLPEPFFFLLFNHIEKKLKAKFLLFQIYKLFFKFFYKREKFSPMFSCDNEKQHETLVRFVYILFIKTYEIIVLISNNASITKQLKLIETLLKCFRKLWNTCQN